MRYFFNLHINYEAFIIYMFAYYIINVEREDLRDIFNSLTFGFKLETTYLPLISKIILIFFSQTLFCEM